MVHIVNGDSTANLLRDAGITDSIIVWREMLSKGPFWQPNATFKKQLELRKEYMASHVGISQEEYAEKSIREISRIGRLKPEEELILWFEFDLFCQINMLACMTYLLELGITQKTMLVCPGINASDKKKQLGYFSANEIPNLLDTAHSLELGDYQLAAQYWEQWSNGEVAVIKKNTPFAFLKEAIETDKSLRHPKEKNNLNAIEQFMLKYISKNTVSKTQLIRACLQEKSFVALGLGDMQYKDYLAGLTNLILEVNGGLKLSKLGINVMKGEKQFSRTKILQFGNVSFS